MNNIDDETLTDIMMGEAVIALLDSGETIGADSLISCLKRMAATEEMVSRKRACLRAVSEIRLCLAETDDLQCHRQNVDWSFYSSKVLPSGKKIH
ncbi:hypothetical protein [Pantoea septica]|uniref:hypothetical protein n=1 Tax=Pantoea septica TaxID=472695 RepID=UPI003D039F3F